MNEGRTLHALLGSRICHDLISPLGAIGNGMELLAMSGIAETPEMALITESVESANARIRFFRVAFGGASPDLQVAGKDMAALVQSLFSSGRVQVDWTALGDLPRSAVKLSCLLILCMESALPRGGRITVGHGGNGWRVAATGDRMSIDPALWSAIIDPRSAPSVTAAEVHFPLVAEAARAGGFTLKTQLSEDLIDVRF